MLDRKILREQMDWVVAQAKRKGVEVPSEEFTTTDSQLRAIKPQADTFRAEMNAKAKEIGNLMAQGKKEEAEAAKSHTGNLKTQIQKLEEDEKRLEAELYQIELRFPNVPHGSVPEGLTPEENVEVKAWKEKPAFDFTPKPHWELAESLKLIDFPAGAKISGSGFPVYTGWGARLQRALISYMIDHQTLSNGYHEIYPPFMVNAESLVGTGNLPKFEEDLYKTQDNLYLVPTAEVPVTNLLRDEILEATALPIKYAAFTACFRREAGSAGKDTRGLLRIHQFDKIELVKFVEPEKSYDELESMLQDAESVLQALGLHYRVLLLCAGDMGEKGCKCYDIEVWSPGVEKYLEISSVTNFEAYQARRANIRYRPEPGAKPEFVHILNGSGLAVPRLFSALVETYQQADGTILIPEPLQKYVGTDRLSMGA
jgi:seryl-tRNA synthetase